MVFECNLCKSTFTFKQNLKRHKFKICEKREKSDANDEPKTESREPKTESREPKTESREPKTESREPKTEFVKVIGNFGKLKNNSWQCVTCSKVVVQQCKVKHTIAACNRYKYGANTCAYCHTTFDKSDTRLKHEKACGKTTISTASINNSNINNINNNNTVNNTVNNTTNIILNIHGNEDFAPLLNTLME
jgi:hypothetical protein